jgi:hypothetical protein
LDFPNHLDIRLVGDHGQDEVAHQSWMVCNQNSHSFHERNPLKHFYFFARARTRFNCVLKQHGQRGAQAYRRVQNRGTNPGSKRGTN